MTSMTDNDTGAPLMLPKAVIFDLDGTLVDTGPDLIAALTCIMRKHSLPDMPAADLRQFIGGGARGLIEKTLAASHLTPSDQWIERIEADFLDFYGGHLADQSRPFPGMREILDMLHNSDILMAVCTNKRQDFAEKILRAFDLEKFFVVISGSMEGQPRKPDPASLLRILSRLSVDAGQAVMVGDSITDIQTARAAHMAMLGVSFGYSPVPMHQLGPDICIDHWQDMPDALAKISSGQRA